MSALFARLPVALSGIPWFPATDEDYSYLNLGGVNFNLTAIILGLAVGSILACIAAFVYRRRVGRVLMALIAARADSPETAKTLAELGLSANFSLRKSLLSPISPLRKLLSVRLPDGGVLDPIPSLDDVKEPGPNAPAEETPTAPPGKTAEATPVAALAPGGGEKIIFQIERAAYFLDDTHRRRAEIRFEKKGNSLRQLIFSIVALAAIVIPVLIYLPTFLGILDSLLSALFGA